MNTVIHCYNSYFLVATVNFTEMVYVAIEDSNIVTVCVLLIGSLERNITINLATPDLANNSAQGE